MAIITIGGQEYTIPALNFKRIKRIWPQVRKAMDATLDEDNVVDSMDAAVQIIAIAIEPFYPEMTADKIEEQMLGTEIEGLKVSLETMLIESGLMKIGSATSGEATGEARDLSTVTATA